MKFGFTTALLTTLCAQIIWTTAEPYQVSVGSSIVTAGSLVQLGYGYNFRPNVTISNVDGSDTTYPRSYFWPLNSYYTTAAKTGSASVTSTDASGASIETTDSTYESYKITMAAGLDVVLDGTVTPTDCTIAILVKIASLPGKQCFIASDCATICQTAGVLTASVGAAPVDVTSSVTLRSNQWYFVAASWKSSGTVATVIVDGVATTATGTSTLAAWTSVKIGTDGTDYLQNGFVTCVQLFPAAYSAAVLNKLKCSQKFDITVSHLPTPEYTVITKPTTGGMVSTSALLDYFAVANYNRTAIVTLSSNDNLAFSSGSNFTFALFASFELPTVGVVNPKPGSILEPRRSLLWLNYTGTHACVVHGEHSAPIPRLCNRTSCGDAFAKLYNPQQPPVLGSDKALTYVLPCGAAAPGQLATIKYDFKFLDVCTACVYESDLPSGQFQVYRCRDSSSQRSWTRRFLTGGSGSGSSALCP